MPCWQSTLSPHGQLHAFTSLDSEVAICGPGTTLSQNENTSTSGPWGPTSGGKGATLLWIGFQKDHYQTSFLPWLPYVFGSPCGQLHKPSQRPLSTPVSRTWHWNACRACLAPLTQHCLGRSPLSGPASQRHCTCVMALC